MKSRMKIFSGTANPELAKEVAAYAGVALSNVDIFKFSNDETFVKINESVRGDDVFIIQPTSAPVNDNLMELLITIDALKRASARRITCVIPYYGYARSDKKDQPRIPITAKLLADLITVAGADRILTLDLHADQIQGFFNIPVDHLFSTPVFLRYFQKNLNIENLVIVSPDSGGANRARYLAKLLDCSLAIGDKRRIGNDGKTEILNIIGDVKDKDTLILDDIVDTGGSLARAAHALKSQGAKTVYAACAHGVLSRNAVGIITESPIEKLFITNSIPLTEEKKACPKIVQLSIAELLAVTIKKIHNEESITIMFRQ